MNCQITARGYALRCIGSARWARAVREGTRRIKIGSVTRTAKHAAKVCSEDWRVFHNFLVTGVDLRGDPKCVAHDDMGALMAAIGVVPRIDSTPLWKLKQERRLP